MPYTPPARSPVASGSVSPAFSRSQPNRQQDQSSPPQSPIGRPNLPRSASSAAYLQKSRRSPAYSAGSQTSRTDSGRLSSESDDVHGLSIHPSLRQSPPPVADVTQMPPGAMVSPPDSTQNSSDDEEHGGRQRAEDLEKLQEEVRRSMDLNRETASPSEEASPEARKGFQPNDFAALANHAKFSPSARKISHNRSATESSFFERRGSSSSHTTTDSDEEDDGDMRSAKPPLLRKKSGELVKPAIRPSSRRRHSSMPGTPTYSKAVHFNDQIEQVRHFLQVDRPIAVSAGGSPAEGYDDDHEFPFQPEVESVANWEIRLADFPRNTLERMSMPVRLEKIDLSSDEKTLIGTVAVANISFQKAVVARFTLDYWKTTSEVLAEYSTDLNQKERDDNCDVFTFSIKLSDQANLETRTLLLCVRYNVSGQEHWDSNDGQNYQVDFVKKVKPSNNGGSKVQSKPAPQLGARPIPRSRHNSSSSVRGRAAHTLDDDFSSGFEDVGSNIRFRNHNQNVPALPNTPPPLRRPSSNNAQQFGVRYDFSASLSAALSQAQAQLGDKSGIKMKRPGAQTEPSTPRTQARPSHLAVKSNFGNLGVAPPTNSGVESPRPEALLANKQSLDSRAYQEFVSKFCFFGSGKASKQPGNKPSQNGTDGTQELDDISPTNNYVPGNDKLNFGKDLDYSPQAPRGMSPNSSGSSSPTPTNSSDVTPRASSPISFALPCHHEGSQTIFSESKMPTAIQG